MGSISRHIMPLVIISLGHRHTQTDVRTHTHTHTHTHTQTCIPTIRTESTLRNQVCTGLWPAHTWFENVSFALISLQYKLYKPFYTEISRSTVVTLLKFFMYVRSSQLATYMFLWFKVIVQNFLSWCELQLLNRLLNILSDSDMKILQLGTLLIP